MVTLAPSTPSQASNSRRSNLARGLGQGSREMQAQVIEMLVRFYDFSQTLPYTYSGDPAAMMEHGVTGHEPFMQTVLGPVGRVVEKLLSLASWPQGWNGADALAPDVLAIAYAIDWIVQMYSVTLPGAQQWIEPNVTASADGEVVFEWWHQHRKLTVYVSGVSATYVRVWGSNIDTEMAEGDIASVSDQQSSWLWLIG